MALSNAEKVRRYRERQKAKKKEEITKAPTGLGDIFKVPFHQFRDAIEPIDITFNYSMNLIGMDNPPDFRFDGTVDPDDDDEDDPLYGVNFSYRSAVETVGLLITAAASLAEQLNDYQKAEIKARLAEIEASDLSDPAQKKAALQEATRLNKMLDQLEKQVRWTFPQWKVTG